MPAVSVIYLSVTHRPSEGSTSHRPMSIGVLYMGVKRPERKVLLSPPFIDEIKNQWRYNLT